MKIIKIISEDDFKLQLFLDDGNIKYFNVKPYLNEGIFKELQDINLFKKIEVDELGGIKWSNGACLSKDTLLIKSFDL